MKTLKKIYTILILICNLLIRRKKYKLHFVAEDYGGFKRWFYDFKHWGFSHGNLEMVCGADGLCEFYGRGKNDLTIDITCSNKPRNYCVNLCDEFVAKDLPKGTPFLDRYLLGRDYECKNFMGNDETKTMWICPVTLFVLGRYPKYIYVRRGVMI